MKIDSAPSTLRNAVGKALLPVAASLLVAGGFFTSGSVAQAQPLSQFNSVDWFEREIGDGVVWRSYHFDGLFNSIQTVNYIEIDLTNPNVDVVVPYNDPGLSPTSTLVPAQYPDAVGAVNATYFHTTLTPRRHNTYVRVDSTEVQGHPTTKGTWGHNGAIAQSTTGDWIVRPIAVSGGSASDWNNAATNVTVYPTLVANGPLLLENGAIASSYIPDNAHCNARHPRTAVGVTADDRLILMTVDGRTEAGAGMSCVELAQVLLQLGVQNALNMDGGGTTTMWVGAEPGSGVVNTPSDGFERGTPNAIAVVTDDPAPVDWDARATNISANPVSPRSNDPVTITATLTNLGQETWTSANVSVVPSRPFGRTSSFIPAGEENTFFEMNPATVPPGGSTTVTLNLVAPVVGSDTVMSEHFALWHETEGYFGPGDHLLRFSGTVRPEIVGAPPMFMIQGGPTGPNNQWYSESAGWTNSTVQFTAEGVSNPGQQRFVWASTQNRSAVFSPEFDVSGIYKVEFAFPGSTNSITNVHYTLEYEGGTYNRVVNQHPGSGEPANAWIELGHFAFHANSSRRSDYSLTISNPQTHSSGDRFYSGAVRFDFVEPLIDVDGWMLH